MGKYAGKTHEEVLALVTADGVVDDDEVAELADYIYADGHVDQAEFNLVVAIDNATQQNSGHSETWPELYAEVVSDYVLGDEDTPGEVSEKEGAELVAAWEGDGVFSTCERAAAESIRFMAEMELPAVLENFGLKVISRCQI